MNRKREIKLIIVIVLFILIQLVPYINKPFHVDDPFYLKMAEQITRDPLRPYSFSINWSGELRKVWPFMEATFPPLIPFYLALIMVILGTGEIIMHSMFLVFPIIAGISMYYLSKRFGSPPLISSLIMASTPVFLVMSTTLMLDTPLLSLWLLSAVMFIYGVDSNNKTLLLLSSIAIGICSLAKYTGLLLFPLLYLYIFLNRKAGRYRSWLLPGLAIFLAWCLHNLLVYNGIHFLLAGQHIGKEISIHKVLSLPVFFAGSLIFPAGIIFCLKKKRAVTAIIIFSLLFISSLLLFNSLNAILLFTVLYSTSLIFLYSLSFNFKKDPDTVFLYAWLLIILLLNLIAEPWVASRYFILCLPPAVILFLRIVSSTLRKPQMNYLIIFTFIITLGAGHLVNYADYLWAKTYRDFAVYVKQKGYNNGYFTGHFGFQYYLEKAGMTAFETKREDIEKGSYFITATLPDPQKPKNELILKLRTVDRVSYESKFPVRTMSPSGRAGFYSSFWGILPFSASNKPLEDFYIFRRK